MDHSQLLDWLLQVDPAIRWQVLRDLTDALPDQVEQERRRVATEGWGAQFLALQDPDGKWGGKIYNPKWTSTHYTLLLLRQLGLAPRHPQALRGLRQMLAYGNFNDGGYNLWVTVKYSDICVDAMLLMMLVYFQLDCPQIAGLIDHTLAHQLPDGGWNCNWFRGENTHSSFHTTLSVLEAFYECEYAGLRVRDMQAARRAGEEFLLQHRLFRSHRTGEVADEKMLKFSFPTRWRYDVLRALDYFQWCRAPYDPRMQDALDWLLHKRLPDGTWKLENRHGGKTFFEMEKLGSPSRWNTLRALRVMRWGEKQR